MNKLRDIINNMFISLVGQAVTWASTLILTIAYGRFLSDSSFAELYFAITFVLLAGFPLGFGFNQQLTRDIAQQPHKALRYFSNTILIKCGLWLLLYTFILIFCWLLAYNLEVRILVAICGVTLLSTATANTFAALHYSFGRSVYPTLGLVLEKGLSTLTGVILLRNGFGVESMALALLGGSLISTLWQGFWFFRLVSIGFTLDGELLPEVFRP
jgi:O-antigen/teichoic acid export membrane protein